MRLISLEIENFRGIRTSVIKFPSDTRFVCLIGAGDSTKSTILLAIEWLFLKTWNLPVCDTDFYDANTAGEITIRGTFTEFPESFSAEDKFGLYLRKPGIPCDGVANDEPEDDSPICLTIQLSIDETLEPHWNIICNRLDPRPISNKERAKLAVGIIGDNCSKDLTWGRYSILQQYADAKGVLHDAYTQALRNAAHNIDLSQLDALTGDIIRIGGQYGVGFENDIRNKLLIQNGSFSTNAGLYDGNIPLNLRGLGSQRLLSMGMNTTAYPEGVVLLIDEIEHGLEPYRLRSLINTLRNNSLTSGQVLITTHSPVALTECNLSEIAIVQYMSGNTDVHTFEKINPELSEQLQRQVRSDADAFLSRALIICEGKTEIGFIKALDDFIATTYGYRMAYKGVGTALGNGENTLKYAEAFKKCGYDLCVFMDSDKEDEEHEKERIRSSNGIPIFDWDAPHSIEQQLFLDTPDVLVQGLVNIAVIEKGVEIIHNALLAENIAHVEEEDAITLTDFSQETRTSLGKMAKRKTKNGKVGEWYKRIDLGREVGQLIFESWDDIDENSCLFKTVSKIIEWVNKL